MAIYTTAGYQVSDAFNTSGQSISYGYDIEGDLVYMKESLPVPTGNLVASEVIPLPDLYQDGKGFTCTGLALDGSSFLIGDIGALQPGGTIQSQIVIMNTALSAVIGTIDLAEMFPDMQDVQGITVDVSDGSIWLCSPEEDKVHHIRKTGEILESISVSNPTGIAYSQKTDTLWILTYSNKILNVSKTGIVLGTYDFSYQDTLDQCFLDDTRGYLYITAGTNYTTANNIYLFNTQTHEQTITCTVDSYSVEGIWIGPDKMIIMNDGYYHSATVAVNQANIYDLGDE